MDVTLKNLHVMDRVGQHHHAPLRKHDVVVDILAQPFPEVEGMIVKTDTFVIKIIGPDNRRVSTCVTAAQPPFIEHGDIGDAMFLG